MVSTTEVVAYLALFVALGIGFLAFNLLIGKLLRPSAPNPEKLEIYECGEATVGSSFVQFDLRFYVIALLFIIFDVELAFFFPWGTVFGKATQLTDPNLPVVESREGAPPSLSPPALGLMRELGVPRQVAAYPTAPSAAELETQVRRDSKTLATTAIVDMGVFFGILLIGFAYVWRRGDLDWVRAVAKERQMGQAPQPPPRTVELVHH